MSSTIMSVLEKNLSQLDSEDYYVAIKVLSSENLNTFQPVTPIEKFISSGDPLSSMHFEKQDSFGAALDLYSIAAKQLIKSRKPNVAVILCIICGSKMQKYETRGFCT